MTTDSPDSLPGGLTPRTRGGARLGALTLGMTQLGSVAATIVLARVLTPAEFGIIALAQSLLGAAKLFAVSGVRAAVVTRRDSVAEAASTYFWTSVGFATLVWVIVGAAAVPLTSVLGQPDAAPYVIVLAGAFFANFVSNVPMALLQRAMRFHAYYLALLAGSMVYFVSEIALAFAGFGAWSVIIGQVLDAVVTLVLAFILARWRPQLSFSRRLLSSDAGFMGGVTLNWGLTYLQRNLDYWIVSGVLGGPLLGVYYIAYVLPNVVRQRLTSVTAGVLLPAYASVQHDQERLERAWQRSWLVQAGLGVPALLGIAALAAPIVAVFFGPQWGAVVVPLQILTVVALVDVHMSTVGVIAVARRRVMWNTSVLAIRTVAMVAFALWAAVAVGTLTAVAWGVALAALVAMVVQEATTSRFLGVGLRPIVRPALTYLGLGVLMMVCVMALVQGTPEWHPIVQLVVGTLMGVAVYLGLGSIIASRYIRPLIGEVRLLVVGR